MKDELLIRLAQVVLAADILENAVYYSIKGAETDRKARAATSEITRAVIAGDAQKYYNLAAAVRAIEEHDEGPAVP